MWFLIFTQTDLSEQIGKIAKRDEQIQIYVKIQGLSAENQPRFESIAQDYGPKFLYSIFDIFDASLICFLLTIELQTITKGEQVVKGCKKPTTKASFWNKIYVKRVFIFIPSISSCTTIHNGRSTIHYLEFTFYKIKYLVFNPKTADIHILKRY